MNATTTRQAFDSSLDIAAATFECESIGSLSASQKSALAEIYCRFGFALVRCLADAPTDAEIRANVVALRPLLGRPAPHNRADADGLVPIVATQQSASVYKGLTAAEFEPHTDGSFLARPDEVLSLTCFEPSTVGGESYLVSGAALYAHLAEVLTDAELAGLFRPDAISIGRGGQHATKPVFQRQQHLPGTSDGRGAGQQGDKGEQSGRLVMSWRCDLVEKGTIHPAAAAGCAAILAFVTDRKNQAEHRLARNEMLLMDNRAVLHARRAFPDGEARRLARCNFFMAGERAELEASFATGFAPAEPVPAQRG